MACQSGIAMNTAGKTPKASGACSKPVACGIRSCILRDTPVVHYPLPPAPGSFAMLGHNGRRNLQLCRFKSHRSIEEITASREFADSATTRVGPIVLALDHNADSAEAVKWTLTNLSYPGEPGERLELVHVVCDPQSRSSPTAVGRNPTGRVRVVDTDASIIPGYREYNNQLLQKASDLVQANCGHLLANTQVPYQVHLPRLPSHRSAAMIGEVLLQEADRLGARVLVVASHGPGAMVEYGSVARYCYQHASMPLVLIPSKKDPRYFGTNSFEFPSLADIPSLTGSMASISEAEQQEHDKVIAHSVPATQSHVPGPMESAEFADKKTSGSGGAVPGYREVLLVVTHLPELEAHWQWVADNLCRHGDVLNIWHVQTSENSAPSLDASLATLPTALAQVLKARGLADVKYNPMYTSTGWADVAKQVCAACEVPSGPRMVCVLNYSRQGMLREAIHGSVASELARHCPVPLVLLQPSMEERS